MSLSYCMTRDLLSAENRELQAHGTSSFPAAAYFDDLRFQDVPWHWHEELEVGIVTEGSFFAETPGQRIVLSRGQGFFLAGNVLHTMENIRIGDTCTAHSIVFHPRLITGDASTVFSTRYLSPVCTSSPFCSFLCDAWHLSALELIEDAWQTMIAEPAGYEFLVRDSLSRLILLLYEHLNLSLPPSETLLRSQARVQTMLDFIHARYTEPLTVADIAESANISESEALRCFHQVLSCPPGQVLLSYRLQQAADQLLRSPDRIDIISSRCGFTDPGYFSRIFKRRYGESPRAYRAHQTVDVHH